jgi:N-methylhydantoinase A/oxoprolinase/acetone carboxylase beta subunit
VSTQAAIATGSALVHLDGEPTELPVYALKDLPPGSAGVGPALFRDAYLTCLVRPGWSFRVSAIGDLILEAQAHV